MQKPGIVKAIWLNATARNWQQIWSKVIWLLHAMLHLQTKESPIHDCLWARKSHGKRKISLKLPVFKIRRTYPSTLFLPITWNLDGFYSGKKFFFFLADHYRHHHHMILITRIKVSDGFSPPPLLPLINVLPPSKPSRSFISAVSFKFQITIINS